MPTLELDASTYSHEQLLELFSLNPNYNDNDLEAAYSRMSRAKSCKNRGVKTFLDKAADRLRSHNATNNTWSAQRTQLMAGTDRPVIVNPNYNAGLNSEISSGTLADAGHANPGWLNPLNVKTRAQTLNFDSRFRDLTKYPSPLSFSINLPVEQNKVIAMRLGSINSNLPIMPSQDNGYMYLEIKDGCQNSSNPFVAVTDVGSVSGDVLARVSNVSTGGGLQTDSVESTDIFSEQQREYFGPVSIRKLEISLLNYKGEPLGNLTDTNPDGLWWSFTLVFTKLYD